MPLDALQVPVVALPPIVPFRVTIPPAQIVWVVPALAVAPLLIVMSTVLVATPHGPVGSFVVSVRVTVPLVIDGVYVALRSFTSEKVPVGALQVLVVALPPIVPLRVTVLPAQIVWVVPALAVATGLTVISTVLVAMPHGPDGSSVVRVRVTVPLVMDGV